MTESDFKKYEASLKELEHISKTVGIPPDYTQGGGGNTSVKLDARHMAVKASGCKLKQITPAEGYVIIDYSVIRDYYEHADTSRDMDFEKESADIAKQSVVQAPWLRPMRPSVEAGFHSMLKKYVIHTHSVYANILACVENGRQLVDEIFGGKAFATAWIPYINPGFCLTLKIREASDDCRKRSGREPEVFFMENHGLIVTSDDCESALRLHQEVNEAIREYLGINKEYPKPELLCADGGTIVSKTEYIRDFIKSGGLKPGYFEKTILYPDQFVYLNDSIAYDGLGSKLNIMTETGEIIYKTDAAEAQTMEETLLACVYVINEAGKRNLPLKTMSEKDIDFIRNWESEAYRKSLISTFLMRNMI